MFNQIYFCREGRKSADSVSSDGDLENPLNMKAYSPAKKAVSKHFNNASLAKKRKV